MRSPRLPSLLLILLLLLQTVAIPALAIAQPVRSGSIAANGATVVVPARPGPIGTVVITGTWTGTLQFEGSLDGSTWFSITATPIPSGSAVTSATANGQWSVSTVVASVRVRASAWTSGTATVNTLFSMVRLGTGGGGAAASTAPLSCDGTNCTMASGTFFFADGSAAAPAWAYTSLPTTGAFRRTNGLGYSVNGISMLVVESGQLQSSSSVLKVAGTDLVFSKPASGAIGTSGTSSPTVAGCGTGATVSGSNSLGTVVVGTTPGTCVVTFSHTWANIPKCQLNNRTSAVANRATGNTTTTFTISDTLTSGDNIDYLCMSS